MNLVARGELFKRLFPNFDAIVGAIGHGLADEVFGALGREQIRPFGLLVHGEEFRGHLGAGPTAMTGDQVEVYVFKRGLRRHMESLLVLFGSQPHCTQGWVQIALAKPA